MKKDDLRQPDAFIATSNNVLHYVEKHAKPIFAVLIVAVLGAAGYVGFNYVKNSQEKKAAAHIYVAEAELKLAQKKVEEDRQKKWTEAVKATGGKAQPKDLDEKIRPANFDGDYAAKVEKIKSAIQDEKGSRAALLSAMSLVSFFGENNRWAQAAEVMKIPTFSPSPKELLYGIAEMHRGLVALETSQLDEATSHYQNLIDNPAQKLLHAEAYLKLGICFEAKKDFKRAKEIYQRLINDYANSDSATEAQQFLQLLELKGAV